MVMVRNLRACILHDGMPHIGDKSECQAVADTPSEQALAPSAHSPSPVAALPMYETLHNLVDDLLPSLPGSMALVGIIVQIRETTWTGLQDALSR